MRSIAVIVLLLALLAHGRALADAAFVLSVHECDELDRAELLALLELELDDVAASFREHEPPLVELRCHDDALRVRIEDPVTGKAIQRSVPRPDGAGAERTIALAVAQLYVTSWLELLTPSAEPLPDRPLDERRAVERRARAAVAPALEAPPERDAALGEVLVFGGAGVRDLESPLPTFVVAASARFAPSASWSVVAGVGLEHGVAGRTRGDVEVWLGHVELGVGVPVLREGPLTLDLSARAGVVLARLVGRPHGDAVGGASLDDVGGRLVAGATATLALDALLLSAAVDLGVDLHLPEGQVSGERSVVTAGPFGQLRLGVGARFR